MKTIYFLTIAIVHYLFLNQMLFAQHQPCLCNMKGFKYKALFMDSIGDTLTNEIIEIIPTGKRWKFQPRKQKSVNYFYSADTIGFQKINPLFQHDRYKNRMKRKGKEKFEVKGNTGFTCSENSYFLHPPRQNQYIMLYHAAYPFMIYSKLSDTLEHCVLTFNNLGPENFVHRYEIFPYVGISPLKDSSKVQLWTVNANSTVTGLSDYFKNLHYHDSKMEGLYCPEIGFIKMHYTFENGIKIYFDYVEENM
jgi:hypothetical protein